MKLVDSQGFRVGTVLASVLALVMVWMAFTAQGQNRSRMSVPHDWSHRHLVFSAPTNIAQAWKLQQEPRFWHQWLRRNAEALQNASSRVDLAAHLRHHPTEAMQRDWGESLLAGGTEGDEMFPAKFTFDINAAPDCVNDYVAFASGLTGALGPTGRPNIVAYNHVYATQGGDCLGNPANGAGPQVYWSYRTGPGRVLTSPTLSLDGTALTFVESSAGNHAILRILKWNAGEGTTITSPASPGNTSVTSLAACPVNTSCMISLPFSGIPQDTNSAPFYDFNSDVAYVGDNSGVLHKFTGVFLGTPVEVTSGGWPVSMHPGTVLSSPVFEGNSRNIFVGDAAGQLSYVREVGSTTGACAVGSPPCLGSTTIALGGPIVDAPIVDGSTQRVLWFDGQEPTNFGEVVQTDTALGNQVTLLGVGGSGLTPTSNMHTGAFDDNYFSTGPSAGFLYFCGKNAGANRDRPSLWRVGFDSTGVMNGTPDGGAAAFVNLVNGDGEECSPLTEFKNGATDRIFFSVGNRVRAAGTTGCVNGAACIMALTLGGTWPPPTPSAVILGVRTPAGPVIAVTGGNVNRASTSGIIIDNLSGGPQASSIYFSFTGNSSLAVPCNGAAGVGCAVKLTQSALQ